jgi:hypothetical protein
MHSCMTRNGTEAVFFVCVSRAYNRASRGGGQYVVREYVVLDEVFLSDM